MRRGRTATEADRSGDPRRPAFGEEDRRLSYDSYLRVPELLSQQRLLSDPSAHDELLFIVVHQVFELWFKELIFELASIRDSMQAGDVHRARHLLKRVNSIERVLIEQVEVLETMSPQDFLEFRTHLAPASGFQSAQFREIEFISGLKDPHYLERLSLDDGSRARLEARLAEPTLWDAFCGLLSARGVPMPANDPAARRAGLLRVARERERFADEFYLSEALLDHDELFALWRNHHVLMVERQIGSKTGTGGSTGASYLRSTLDKRFYPELWELRSYL
ncbi:MAG: tryptophan 2,3-dioxygenase family protein [Actinomycetota bacterium]|nr:tryptophan 2,3-dioxygenase family protein [Actinomycetota bacterium]